jgi:hypothetical protein
MSKETNGFEIKPNSQVQYRTPEEMHKYLRELIMNGVKRIQARPKYIVVPGDQFPYNLDAGKCVEYLEKVTSLMVKHNSASMARWVH